MRNWKEINKSEKEVNQAKKEGYTHILEVDGERLFVLKDKYWEDSANEIAEECGYERHDHSSEVFMGSGFDDDQFVQSLIND